MLQTDFLGDHNIGLFAKACDRMCLAGRNVSDGRIKEISGVLDVDVVSAAVADTGIVGIFCAMNSSGILLPKITRQAEVRLLKSSMKEHGMSVGILGSKFTAVGNLVLCNDKGAVYSRLLSSEDKRIIEDCLDVEAEKCTVAGLDSVGSCGIATNGGCVLHRDASEEELDAIQEVLKADTDIGTANFGSPFVGSCAVANKNGIVVGESTTGPEVTRMMETLGLL